MAPDSDTVAIYLILHRTIGPQYVGYSTDPERQVDVMYARARSKTPRSRDDRVREMRLAKDWLADAEVRPEIEVVERDVPRRIASKRRNAWMKELNRRGYWLLNER